MNKTIRTPIIMHVNYCEQGQSVAEILSKAEQWGFDGVELRQDRNQRGIKERHSDYLDAIEQAMERTDLEHIIFGSLGPDLMQEDADGRKKEVADYIAFLELAKSRFGSKWFNARTGALPNPDPTVPYSEYEKNGSGAAQPHHYEQAIEGFKPVARFAEENDLIIGFETHMNYLHDLPTPCKQLTDGIGSPNVGATFDYANMNGYTDPVSMEEAINVLDDSILYLHLKNHYRLPTGGVIRSDLGSGQINNREMLKLLFSRGFDAPICIEAPRPGDREWFAQQDLAYLKSVLADMNR